jgi:hypothetical protein
MPIKFNCPKCGQELNVKDEMAGKQGKCPKCKSTVTVPTPAAPRAAAAPPVRKKPVREVEEVEEVEEAEVVEEDEPPRRRSQAVKKGKNDFDFSDEEEEDTRVSSRRSSRRRDDDEDEDEPRRMKKSRRDDDDEDEDEPRRGKRASAKRRRDDDEDDYDDEDEGGSSEKRKKARERQRRKAWRKATTGVFLGFISMCTYTGACGLGVLIYIIFTITLLSGKLGMGGFGGILGYLVLGLLVVSWILFIVSGSFLVTTPGKNGEMGLGIATLSTGAVTLLFFVYLWFSLDAGIFGAFGGGLSFTAIFLPLLELARLSLFAIFQWAVSKTMKDSGLTSTSLLMAIVIPSAAFGGALFTYLLGLLIESAKSRALGYLGLFVFFCELAAWAGLMAWFTLHTSSVKNSMDHA